MGNSVLGKNGKAQTSQREGDQQPHQKFSCSAISEQEIASKSSFSPNLSQSHALRPLCRAFPPLFPNACPAQQRVGSAGWHRAVPSPWQMGVMGQKQLPWVAGMGPVPVVPMKPPPQASATKCRVLSAPSWPCRGGGTPKPPSVLIPRSSTLPGHQHQALLWGNVTGSDGKDQGKGA